MSRGPGKVERAIEAAFLASPDATFSVADLGPIAYPGLNRVEKRHRVAIIRAADRVAARHWWAKLISERPGGQIIYCNTLDVRSYAIGRMRADFLNNTTTVAQIEALLEEPAPDDPWRNRSKWDLVRPGGAWWRHVEIARARKAGDAAEAERINTVLRAEVAERFAALKGKS
ncbi:hypothetical protein MKK67_11665 [Methylobacterium sp. J-072]|uniref:hypothetical protein n=1 Tax=Methylobacterium sp. J-072 TaxID=2836651 RepID=UPI001FB943AF|nr:hypothetical protein [Methylobacterium sp. J-072]MCJ2093149.1 hypothetical protein [Methylobacterium sp. J-072]